MNIERTDPRGALDLAEFFSSPTDEKLIKELRDLTRDYIKKIRGLDPANLAAIEEARDDFDICRSRIIHYAEFIPIFGEKRSSKDKANRARQAAAGIAEELFTHLNLPPVVEVQEKPWFRDLFKQKPPRPLEEWQRGNLIQAACAVITYAAKESKSYTEHQVNPDLLDAIKKGIQGWHEEAKANFPANIRQFVANPQALEKSDK